MKPFNDKKFSIIHVKTLQGNILSQILSPEIQKLADEVVRYLEKHEQAADTVEGIARWWIMQQRIQEETSKVEQALEYLCKAGALEKREMSDGSIIYHRTKDFKNGLSEN